MYYVVPVPREMISPVQRTSAARVLSTLSVHLQMWEKELGVDFADLGDLRAEIRSVRRLSLNYNMSTSKTPPDIIQEGEKNPRGIPKALFIVRSSFSRRAGPPRFALADHHLSLPPSIHRTTWRNILAAQMRPSKGLSARSRML
jgi:hypothetical protein